MRYLLLALVVILALNWLDVRAEDSIFFALCSVITCERAVDQGVTEETSIEVDKIVYTAVSSRCPAKCTEIKMVTRETAHVMGFWLDVECRTRGGQFCVWNDEVLHPDKAHEIIRKSYGRPKIAPLD